MRHDRTDPCPVCPFLKTSASGWLGSYKPAQILDHIRKEIPFPCHATVNYDDPIWRDQVVSNSTKVQSCAGFLIMGRRMCKIPRDPELSAQAKRVNLNADVFQTPQEFIEHHTRMKP